MKGWATWACEDIGCREKNARGTESLTLGMKAMRTHVEATGHIVSMVFTVNVPESGYAPDNAMLFEVW